MSHYHPPIIAVPGSGQSVAVTDAGVVVTLATDPSSTTYRRWVCRVATTDDIPHWRAGDNTMVAGDVVSFSQSATAADGTIPNSGLEEIIDLYGYTHLGFRTQTGQTATVEIYADDQFEQGW